MTVPVMDRLSNADLGDLIAFRRALHRRPEVSGAEAETAATIADALRTPASPRPGCRLRARWPN